MVNGRGRPHHLDDPEFAQQVAELFVAGCSRTEMCDALGVQDPKTITKWRRDPRVTTIAKKLISDRVLEITRKTDAEIATRLMNASELTVKEILDIRKEFLGGALREQTQEVDEHTINEAMSLFESNPEVAQQLRDLLAGGAKGARPADD